MNDAIHQTGKTAQWQGTAPSGAGDAALVEGRLVRIRAGAAVLAASADAVRVVIGGRPRYFLPLRDIYLGYFDLTSQARKLPSIGTAAVWLPKAERLLPGVVLLAMREVEPVHARLIYHGTFTGSGFAVEHAVEQAALRQV